jgi:hypothetical protein
VKFFIFFFKFGINKFSLERKEKETTNNIWDLELSILSIYTHVLQHAAWVQGDVPDPCRSQQRDHQATQHGGPG